MPILQPAEPPALRVLLPLRESARGAGSRALWIPAGAAGGVLLGATIAGPAGAAAGVGIGVLAGLVRVVTGKSVVQNWVELDEESKQRIVRGTLNIAAGDDAGGGAAAAGGGNGAGTRPVPSAPPLTPDAVPSAYLGPAELDAVKDHAAEGSDPQCVVCLHHKVAVALQPCGHACSCAGCCAMLLRERQPACPICRSGVAQVLRVYL